MINTSLFANCLKEERKRLGLTQANAAELVGVNRETWGRYESGKIMPGTEVLIAFTYAGADANYLLTGNRSGVISTNVINEMQADGVLPGQIMQEVALGQTSVTTELTQREAALVDHFRNSSKEGQAALMSTGIALAQSKKSKDAA
ncbi:helix-turn-helix transcriptional regulator [Sapientia aquatica]|uniref:Helix-turn-helix domain-containing protein n=1 Tax=Sapientia aquatica TaxID=1549640 RepID=A0A4R5W3T4_9BURK|nr:helix-turn-helix transcriptional regulator [Sapientia aquatica]TDK65999.1 helix-turn-helix domain-containing protein [Sapientia aquatica]